MGRVVELREVGGLRHRYERRAALTELDAIPFAGLSCLTRKFVTTMYTLPGSRTIKVQHTWVFRAPSHLKSFSDEFSVGTRPRCSHLNPMRQPASQRWPLTLKSNLG